VFIQGPENYYNIVRELVPKYTEAVCVAFKNITMSLMEKGQYDFVLRHDHVGHNSYFDAENLVCFTNPKKVYCYTVQGTTMVNTLIQWRIWYDPDE
jgi:hypothetical protein